MARSLTEIRWRLELRRFRLRDFRLIRSPRREQREIGIFGDADLRAQMEVREPRDEILHRAYGVRRLAGALAFSSRNVVVTKLNYEH